MADRLLPAIAQVVGVALYLRPRPYDPHMSNKSKARKGPRLRPKQRMRFEVPRLLWPAARHYISWLDKYLTDSYRARAWLEAQGLARPPPPATSLRGFLGGGWRRFALSLTALVDRGRRRGLRKRGWLCGRLKLRQRRAQCVQPRGHEEIGRAAFLPPTQSPLFRRSHRPLPAEGRDIFADLDRHAQRASAIFPARFACRDCRRSQTRRQAA